MHLALYRKWRPKSFEDVLSQSHITTTLKNEIAKGQVGHAYLFTGSRGTGKTTCAKIFAKAVNCPHAINGEPCHECEVCKGLEDGTILDVDEMDAASNNRVDDIRVLCEEANYTPVTCKYRVYIIDEAHMLTTSAFNAFLKVMEEPPAHVIFILATTEVYKIPSTIISRCQRFDFHRIECNDIKIRLMDIAKNEGVHLEEEAADLIAHLADGGMRDALSILDQAIAYSDSITAEIVTQIAGAASDEYLYQFHQVILQKNCGGALELIQDFYQQAKDLYHLSQELIRFYRDLLVLNTTASSKRIIFSGSDQRKRMEELAQSMQVHQILNVIDALQELERTSLQDSDFRISFEISMIKLCMGTSEKVENRVDFEEQSRKPILEQKMPDSDHAEQKTQSAHETKSRLELSKSLSTNKKPVVFEEWIEILDVLQGKPSCAMLNGFLKGSQAFVLDDRLYIQSVNGVVADKILEKKEFIDQAIFEVTGKKYRLLMKREKEKDMQENAPVQRLINQALDEGISVDEDV